MLRPSRAQFCVCRVVLGWRWVQEKGLETKGQCCPPLTAMPPIPGWQSGLASDKAHVTIRSASLVRVPVGSKCAMPCPPLTAMPVPLTTVRTPSLAVFSEHC